MAITTAAYGWLGQEWDHFYPDDLPVEWRLDYYANEFFAVVVPFNEWSGAEDEELLAWQDQVSSDFRFYWELPVRDDEVRRMATDRLERLRGVEALASHWGGIVELAAGAVLVQSPYSGGGQNLLCIDEELPLRALRELIEAVHTEEGGELILMVKAGASASLYPARDLAQLLGGG